VFVTVGELMLISEELFNFSLYLSDIKPTLFEVRTECIDFLKYNGLICIYVKMQFVLRS
jgi:hypothetical protein